MRRDKRAIRQVVYEILKTDVNARNRNSKYLYVCVVKRLNPELSFAPLAIALQNADIPNMETVRRSRQFIQAKFPELRASDNVQAARELEEEDYKEVFGNGRRMDKTS